MNKNARENRSNSKVGSGSASTHITEKQSPVTDI